MATPTIVIRGFCGGLPCEVYGDVLVFPTVQNNLLIIIIISRRLIRAAIIHPTVQNE
jgi:hypothetical protein